MFARIFAVALNTYREAVRAWLLLAMVTVALATSVYSLVIGTVSLHHEARVVADVGAASTSFYAVLTAVMMGATSLYREIELKTIFPMLARPLRRHEYLLGKYFGMLVTLTAFVLIDVGLVLALLAVEAGASIATVAGAGGAMLVVLGLSLWQARRWRVYVALPWSIALVAVMVPLAAPAGPDRQLVLLSALLTVSEATIVAAVATLFSSFSSPFWTAVFTLGIFIAGRSADTLAHMPEKVFGRTIHDLGVAWTRVLPNLQFYVPPRALLVGDVPSVSLDGFIARAVLHAVVYASAILVLAVLVFRRRDFQ
jgi:ABC-type transport system involved in multi-copper enzyme maturation permease subunit